MSEHGPEKASRIFHTPRELATHPSSDVSFAELSVERIDSVLYNEREKTIMTLDVTSEDTHIEDEDTRADKQVKSRPLTFFEKLSKGVEHAVDFLEERLLPVMTKPLTRIAVGTAMLCFSIVILLTPIPGGVILVPVSIGVIFGVGPRRTWNATKKMWRGTKALWRKLFPKKDEEKTSATAPA